jgi:predicted permease
MLQVFALVAPLFGLIIFGFIAGKMARIRLDGLGWMNFFIIYVALPAMIYHLLSKTPVSEFASVNFVIVTTSATFYMFVLSFFIAMLRGRGKRSAIGPATIQGFAGAYGNIGYLGPPLAIAAFGPAAIAPAAMIFSFDNTLHFTLAPSLMALTDNKPQKRLVLVGKIVWRIITHPFIIATAAGLTAAVFNITPPAPIERMLELLANAAAPCALFVMGVTAALRPLKAIPVELGWLIPFKLLLHPALAYILLDIFGPFDPIFVKTAVLLAALPSATNVFVIAQQYNTWQERASSTVVLSTLFSMISVTLVLYYLQ